MFKAIQWILLIYGVFAGLFYAYQQHFYFQPVQTSNNEPYTFAKDLKYANASLPFDNNTVIDIVKFLPDDSIPKGVVLFFHGNRDNVNYYSSYAPYFSKKGYECWMPDYPGYGRSTGELSVDLLEKLATQLYRLARTKYSPQEILIYGKSLGTGVAAYLASRNHCRAVMLETPYYSLSSLTSKYLFFLPVSMLIKYEIDTYQHLKTITAPVTIILGDKDELIPVTNAAGLLNYMKSADAFYILPGGRHNTLPTFPLYNTVLDSVLNH